MGILWCNQFGPAGDMTELAVGQAPPHTLCHNVQNDRVQIAHDCCRVIIAIFSLALRPSNLRRPLGENAYGQLLNKQPICAGPSAARSGVRSRERGDETHVGSYRTRTLSSSRFGAQGDKSAHPAGLPRSGPVLCLGAPCGRPAGAGPYAEQRD